MELGERRHGAMARREAYLLIPRGGVLRGWTCQTHVRKLPPQFFCS